MAQFDYPWEVLKTYHSADPCPADFDDFWSRTIEEVNSFPLSATFVPLDNPVTKHVEISDVTFRGYGGQPIKGWFLAPAGEQQNLPCIVTFLGYGGGRGLPESYLLAPVCGFAQLVMDTRGQGGRGVPGDTFDNYAAGPQYPGFMTRGIESPDTYFYRRVFTDAVRAIEAAASHPQVDATRLAASGGSQGGAIATAATALSGNKVKLLMADVPFLCNFRRAVRLVDTYPYDEISGYLAAHRGKADQVFSTLDYFDIVNFAPRVSARTLYSVALMDTICPPSSVYAAYNALSCPKDLRVYEFNNHEGGGPMQEVEKMKFALQQL